MTVQRLIVIHERLSWHAECKHEENDDEDEIEELFDHSLDENKHRSHASYEPVGRETSNVPENDRYAEKNPWKIDNLKH